MKKLEKHWRKSSGAKSTSIKKKSKAKPKPIDNSAQVRIAKLH